MKKQKSEADLSVTFEIVFMLLGSSFINALLPFTIEKMSTGTYIGTAGLLTVRRQLVWYLISRIIRFFAPLICVLISGFFVHLFRREPLRPSGDRVRVGLLLCLPWYLAMIQNRTGFEQQCDINGYRGIRPVKAVMLLIDVQKDLNDASAQKTTYYLKKGRDDFGYTLSGTSGRYSSHHKVLEYMLSDERARRPVVQISEGDYKKAENLCIYTEHTLALYPHSGFLASFDGGDMSGINDLETLFTLTRSGNIITRSVHPREEEMRSLTMVLRRNGEEFGRISAAQPREEWLDIGLDTEVWLEMLYDGNMIRVSNILQF
jgi:hypothetical protein